MHLAREAREAGKGGRGGEAGDVSEVGKGEDGGKSKVVGGCSSESSSS